MSKGGEGCLPQAESAHPRLCLFTLVTAPVGWMALSIGAGDVCAQGSGSGETLSRTHLWAHPEMKCHWLSGNPLASQVDIPDLPCIPCIPSVPANMV